MNIQIRSKNLNPSDALKNKIEAKMSKLEKYFSSDTEAQIMLSEEKTGLAKLEATIKAGGMIFRAEESNSDLFFCLDKVIDKLSSQMSKFKKKLIKKHKDQKEIFLAEVPDVEEAVEETTVVKTKSFALTPMTTDEAILQMELLAHNFFVFADPETGKADVIYKRADGQYGLLKTE
ncbi:MAG: ribosome-associated translation inhibitor RaiA [Clostridia bacterium]|nr:ribosome-associated translation inhibitor RaiA [Clostridia bacterium]